MERQGNTAREREWPNHKRGAAHPGWARLIFLPPSFCPTRRFGLAVRSIFMFVQCDKINPMPRQINPLQGRIIDDQIQPVGLGEVSIRDGDRDFSTHRSQTGDLEPDSQVILIDHLIPGRKMNPRLAIRKNLGCGDRRGRTT